tara:strand:- start:3195 stop:5255 length:2061 start_codon:yes stop_codon:yes gene_type:complete
MAYKFQLGSAILSGSTKFEELVEAAGGFKPTVADTAAAVADDSFYFQDADGAMKRESMADYATAIAGDGLAASSGVLAVGVDDSSIETDSDALRVKDLGITRAKLAADAVDGTKLADDAVDSEHIADGSIDLAHMSANSVDSDQYVDGSIDLVHMSANSVDSDQYVDGSIDTIHIADAQITLAKMAVDSVDSDQYVDGSIDTAHIADAQVTEAKLATSVAGVGLSGGGGSALAVDLNELVAEQVASGDFFAFVDSTDNGTHKETVDDLATLFAGNGLSAASAVMALDLNELSAAAIDVANDSFALIDANDSNGSRKESFADYATAIAGTGLKADAGVLEVRVTGSVIRSGDKIGISGSIAGDGLKFLGSATSVTGLEVDLNEMSAGAVAVGADHFVFVDADDSITKKESFADFATAIAGNGLAASSGVLAVGVDDSGIELNSDALRLKDNGVTLAKMAGIARGSIISGDASGDPQALAAGSAHQFLQSDGTDLAYVSMSGDATLAAGVLSIGATKVTDAMMNDDVATGLAGVGLSAASGVLALDSSELSDAAVASGDKFVFQDATDDSTKKESIDDIATFMAGPGLNAASGVLSARLDVAAKADGGTLAAGMNFFADLSSNATVTLPASPTVGDTVFAKAKGLSSAVITINKAGSQTIDGETSVTIESPYGAVSMVYVATNDWRLV